MIRYLQPQACAARRLGAGGGQGPALPPLPPPEGGPEYAGKFIGGQIEFPNPGAYVVVVDMARGGVWIEQGRGIVYVLPRPGDPDPFPGARYDQDLASAGCWSAWSTDREGVGVPTTQPRIEEMTCVWGLAGLENFTLTAYLQEGAYRNWMMGAGWNHGWTSWDQANNTSYPVHQTSDAAAYLGNVGDKMPHFSSPSGSGNIVGSVIVCLIDPSAGLAPISTEPTRWTVLPFLDGEGIEVVSMRYLGDGRWAISARVDLPGAVGYMEYSVYDKSL